MLLLLLSGCSRLLTVHVEQDASTLVEGAGLVGELLDALSFTGFDDLSVSVDEELANQGVERGDVTEAYVTELVLSTPDGDDLSFLKTLEFDIASDGLETQSIAHGDSFPEGEKTVALTLDGVDLTPYLEAESLTITTAAEGSAPADDTTIDAHIALDIVASVQGAAKAAKDATSD